MAQCKGKRGELWYHSIIHYNVEHFKGSYGRPESHISLILDYQLCTCVMRTSGIPQLQVIRMERLYGYKWHVMYDRWVYHCFTDGRIWASLGKAGITIIAYNFRRDRTTGMRPLDDTASTKMYSTAIHFHVGLEGWW